MGMLDLAVVLTAIPVEAEMWREAEEEAETEAGYLCGAG